MQTVWVTGAQGLIGSHIVAELERFRNVFDPRPILRTTLDLERFDEVDSAFERDDPAVIVHCAANSDTSFCEANPDRAYAVNVDVTAKLAELAQERQLIFFSSDLVFDGRVGDYDETATVRPLSVYGKTKAAAECIVLSNPRHTVIRTSMTAGRSPRGNKGFDETLVRSWQEGRNVTLFVDEFRTPIAAEVTACAIREVIEKALTGLYHLGGAERLSRYQIGSLLASHYSGLQPKISPGSLKDFQSQTRPADCSMNSAKLQRELSFRLPAFSDWLRRVDTPYG